MGILLRVIKLVFFVAAILALGQIRVGEKRIAEHVTSKATAAWKSGPEVWIKQGAAQMDSESVRHWLSKIGIETDSRPAPRRRATRPRPIVDDIAERDRIEMQKLLEKESK